MFCTNCGKEIVDNAKFCKYCGNNIVPTNLDNRNKRIHSDNIKKSNDKKRIKRFSVMGAGLLVLVIGLIVVNLIITNKKYVDIEDPLVERCIRETLNKEDDEKITLEECASIKSLLIDCQYDTSFSVYSTYVPNFMLSNYVDLCDFKYLTGLEELYIDNSNNSEYIANLDAITNCTELKKLYIQYDPSITYYSGETARGYKYLKEIIEQLPNLEYLDLGCYVTPEYQNYLKESNEKLEASNGDNDSYLYSQRLLINSDEANNRFWADSVEEYINNWQYGYEGKEKLSCEKTTKAGISVSSEEELKEIVAALPNDIEDIFINVSLEELDLLVFDRFDNLKTFSIVGTGKCMGNPGTEIKNLEILNDKSALFSLNISGCSGDFSQIKKLDNLKQLSLVWCDFESFDFISQLTNLRELTLLYNNYRDAEQWDNFKDDMENIYAKLKNLKFLRVLDDNSLKGIEKCEKLETIFWWGTNDCIETFVNVSQCNSLKNLVVACGSVEAIDLEPLSSVSSLETLVVKSNYVSNLCSVLQLPQIRSVDVKDVANQYDSNYINTINQIIDVATQKKSISYISFIYKYGIEECQNRADFENINFKQLYDYNIFDGCIQVEICCYPQQMMTFEDAYEHFFNDYVYDI